MRLLASEPALLEAAVLPALADYSSSRNESLASLVMVVAQHLLLTEPPQHPGPLPSSPADSEAGSEGGPGEVAAAEGPSAAAARAAWEARLAGAVRLALPWTTSFVHAPRTFTQLCVWRLLELYPAVLVAPDPTMAALLAFFRSNADLGRLRGALGREGLLPRLNLEYATSPAGVFVRVSEREGGAAPAAP